MQKEHADRFLATLAAASPEAVASGLPANRDPLTVLNETYSAIASGDYEKFNELFTEDVTLHIAGMGPIDGSWHGRDEVRETARKNYAALGDQQPAIEEIISNGNSIAVLLRETGMFKASGTRYQVRCVQWFTFAGGKIQKISQVIAHVQD